MRKLLFAGLVVCAGAVGLGAQASRIEENVIAYWTLLGLDGWNESCAYYGDAGTLFTEFVQFDVHGRLVCADGQTTIYGGALREFTSTGFCNAFVQDCLPTYTHETWDAGGEHHWKRTSTGKGFIPNPMDPELTGICYNAVTTEREHSTYFRYLDDPFCPPIFPPECNVDPSICTDGGGWLDYETCQCRWSPIIIDLEGDGIALTSAQEGVPFDLNADGVIEQVAWQRALQDDAFLVLDRNRDGAINDGRELFGSVTPQPLSPEPNGFLALAEYDLTSKGGNGDGLIDRHDAVFTHLRAWTDNNHNGAAESSELRTLLEVGVGKMFLNYTESRRTDEFGNRFRYKARVVDSIQRTRWVWDVFLNSVH